jgi:hypothetical protein
MMSNKIVELATELGHARAYDENSEVLENDEDNMYIMNDDQDCGHYTIIMQIEFNYWYDYYYNKIIKIFNNAEHDI